jgi:hypothetical protein
VLCRIQACTYVLCTQQGFAELTNMKLEHKILEPSECSVILYQFIGTVNTLYFHSFIHSFILSVVLRLSFSLSSCDLNL